jgi:Methyl-accepting chemotaxis protein
MLRGNGLIDHLLAIGPYFKEVFGKDLVVWISDTDNILGYFAGEHFDVGSDGILAADDPMRIAMKKRQTIKTNMPAGIAGIPFKEIDNPVYDDNNNVVGCITIGVSLDQETKVINVANSINEAVENIDSSVKEFTESAENIRNSERILRDNISGINELTKEINKVLKFTKKITVQTNLLSMNAAIEASRAGQYGLGFGVVADEIRKLSDDTMQTAKTIESLISQINNANKITMESADKACTATEEQVASTEKTKTKIEDLKYISEELRTLSEEI